MRCRIYAPVGYCVLIWLAGVAAQAASPTLQIHGRVELPGGAPATHARLCVLHNNLNLSRSELQADADGRFTIADPFLEHTVVIAQSIDRKQQRHVAIAETEARTLATKSLRIELRPARQVKVHVTRDGNPVSEVQVAVDDTASSTITSREGEAVLLVPDGLENARLSAWHPQLGISGAPLKLNSADMSDLAVELALQAPHLRRIRVVDHLGRAVPGLLVCPNFKPADSDWFLSRSFESLTATTDAAGEVEIAWAPKDLKYVNLDGSWLEWVMDQVIHPTSDEETVVARVRSKHQMPGRLIVPENCNPTGLLVVGQGFGPGRHIAYAAARAAADGSFSLAIAPEYSYAIAVCDRSWTSEPLTGVLARLAASSQPPPFSLRVEPATPLELQATIGVERKPLRDVHVSVGRIIRTEWIDAAGDKKGAQHNLSDWIRTDETGSVRSGLGRGEYRVSIAHENWREEKTLTVKSDGPVSINFHKPYEHRRQISGQLAQVGRTGDFSGVKVTAVEYNQSERKSTELTVGADGRFVFSTDCQRIGFFVFDGRGAVCGSAVATEAVSALTIDLSPTASYEGQVLGPKDLPIAVVGLELTLQAAPEVLLRRATSDANGRFQFDRVISGLPLRLSAHVAGKRVVLDEHYFEPGEQRQGIRVRFDPGEVEEQVPSPRPLAQQFELKRRDARLARMHVLVVINTDNLESKRFVQRSVLSYDDVPAVLDYLPMVLDADALRRARADYDYVKQAGWPIPAVKEISLAALDGAGQLLGAVTISVDSATAADQARKFLDEHRPPVVNGEELWLSALAEAKQSGRRVLMQFGGPRCGPCFLLSRWTDDHHVLLERDYVLLKLQLGRQLGAGEIEKRVRRGSGGIPWTAIVDAEGNMLATSDGPLGNVGFPSGVEGVRHFQRMLEKTASRLTAADIADLVSTLRE